MTDRSMLSDWRLAALADSIEEGRALAQTNGATISTDRLKAWIAETARRIRLFPIGVKYANSWENHIDVYVLMRDLKNGYVIGEHEISNLIYNMINGLHNVLPKLEGQARTQSRTRPDRRWDVFISHSSRDIEFVRELAAALRAYHLEVWIDRDELVVGDAPRHLIDRALADSRYGVVVLSPTPLDRIWPRREVDALFEMEEVDRKVILPVLHHISVQELRETSPLLAGRLGLVTEGRAVTDLAYEIARAVAQG